MIPRAAEQPNQCAATTEPAPYTQRAAANKARAPTAHAPHQSAQNKEKLAHRNYTGAVHARHKLKKALMKQQRPSTVK